MDRLNAQDLMMLWPEELGWSQDIGALAILDGRPLLDADGRFRIETAREQVGARLHLAPRFRQLLYRPGFGLGWPLWIDAPCIDLAEHVRVLPLAAPADESQLLLACEELRRRRLDRSRPLWELWFLPGLPDGRVGLFMKLHHAIADGVAGVAALGAFVDLVPDPPGTSAPPWTPAASPSPRDLFADNLRRRLHEVRRALRTLAHPVDTVRQARRGWPAVREAFAEGRAPATSLNRRIGSHRRFALLRSDLGLVKRIAHAHHAKVNDVLMAVLAGGLRALLVGRGEPVDGLVWPLVRVVQRRRSPEKAGHRVAFLASPPRVSGYTGQYFEGKPTPKRLSPRELDPEYQQRAWQLGAELVAGAGTRHRSG
jgi:diacylglycerol O-acyltransferase / wax synthase